MIQGRLGFPGGSVVKNPTAVQKLGFDPWVTKIPWRKKCQPTLYSFLGNPIYRGAWQDTVYGVRKELDNT